MYHLEDRRVPKIPKDSLASRGIMEVASCNHAVNIDVHSPTGCNEDTALGLQ
jgi:hypothetical protein